MRPLMKLHLSVFESFTELRLDDLEAMSRFKDIEEYQGGKKCTVLDMVLV